MKLIIATPSPYARKIRVIMREKKIKFEEIIDVPWNTNTLTHGLNPLGKYLYFFVKLMNLYLTVR